MSSQLWMNLLTLVPRVCGSVCCSRRHTSAVHLALRRAAYPPSRASQTRSRQTNAVESVHRGVIISKAECTVRRFCRRKSDSSLDRRIRSCPRSKQARGNPHLRRPRPRKPLVLFRPSLFWSLIAKRASCVFLTHGTRRYDPVDPQQVQTTNLNLSRISSRIRK